MLLYINKYSNSSKKDKYSRFFFTGSAMWRRVTSNRLRPIILTTIPYQLLGNTHVILVVEGREGWGYRRPITLICRVDILTFFLVKTAASTIFFVFFLWESKIFSTFALDLANIEMGIFSKDVTMQVVPIYKTYNGRKPFYQSSIIGKRSAQKTDNFWLPVFLCFLPLC